MQLAKIIGQPIATTTLQRSIAIDQIAHAYLFYGDIGVGKRTAAESFVNHLLCETKSACGSCGSCAKLARNNHPGYRVLESDSSIKIDQIRDLQEQVQLSHKDYQIWVITDVDKMTLQAANSFLKLLEEPPKRTIFLLLTNNLANVLPTIRSRCQVLKFSRLANGEVEQLLRSKLSLDSSNDQKISLITKMARGSIGRALELWDSPALERRNWVTDQLLRIPTMSIVEVLGLSYKWDEDRNQVKLDLELMLQWYRDLWWIKVDNDSNDLLYNLDRKNDLTAISQKYSQKSIENITELIFEMLIQLSHNVRVRFIIGHLLLQMRKGALAQ